MLKYTHVYDTHLLRGHINIQPAQIVSNPTRTIPVLILWLLIVTLVACQNDTPPPNVSPSAPPPAPQEAEVEPGPATALPPTAVPQVQFDASATDSTAIIGLIDPPETLNPFVETRPALREMSPLLFETLLQANPETATLQPGLARAWEFSDDGGQVQFHLPANLKWSDGSPMTAATIIESLQASQHPALAAFSSLSAPDATTLSLTAATINCSAVTALAQLPLIPSRDITATIPTGSGPFVVANQPENKRSLDLVRNINYHGVEPGLEQIIIRFLREDEVSIALSEGQFDLVGPLPSPLTSERTAGNNLQIPARFSDIAYPAGQMVYLALNFDPKNGEPLPAKARQALMLAFDRETLLAETLDNQGQLLAGSLLPGHWAAANNLTLPAYNPNSARQLLNEAGLRDSDGDGWLEQNGERLELSMRLDGRNPLHQNLGWLISSYLREVGVFTRAEGAGFDSVVNDLFTHDFHLAIFSWPILADPDQQQFWRSTENKEGFGLNFTSYANSQLDRQLDQANSLPGCDPIERAKIYADIQQILSRDRPVDFLLAPNDHILVAGRLQGIQPGPFAPLTWNIADWHLQKE